MGSALVTSSAPSESGQWPRPQAIGRGMGQIRAGSEAQNCNLTATWRDQGVNLEWSPTAHRVCSG